GIKLASKAGVQVIPVAIKTDFWRNGRLLKDMGFIKRKLPIHIKIGTPMHITGTGKEEQAAIIEFIKRQLAHWNS
ncbi:MAG: 1-acyl-sn-glycerol-3-phosphate acyltransferase, partial [Bacteroidota bacterium]